MKEKGFLLISLFLILIIVPLISADIITPGKKEIMVSNVITNINDFPDYVFISGGNPGIYTCPYYTIGKNGLISNQYYKFCGPSVYAIKRDSIDLDKFEASYGNFTQYQELEDYFNSLEKSKVIESVTTSKIMSLTSPLKSVRYEYKISPNQVSGVSSASKEPEKIKRKFSVVTILIYFLIFAIALFFIIRKIKRKRR